AQTEETTETTAAETTAPETTAETTTAETEAVPAQTAAETEVTAETETVAEVPASAAETADTSNYTSNKQVVEKNGSYPNEQIVTKAFELKAGEAAVIESADGEHYYVIARLDLSEDASYFETAKESLLFEMKEEDYDALVATWLSSQDYIPNEDARKRYDPAKIFKES
ncbi:MAG: hypothetical protein IJ080_08620, partial [Oscillospiraceae bacterium]|nr:hypothetical protein [Oscillospiraceae bacterium]